MSAGLSWKQSWYSVSIEAVGILVFGDNHLILRGPEPSAKQARAMVKHWSVIELGRPPGDSFCTWRISTREFRENLSWAVHLAGKEAPSSAVRQLLDELLARGIAVRTA
jgi:hypothetical protein